MGRNISRNAISTIPMEKQAVSDENPPSKNRVKRLKRENVYLYMTTAGTVFSILTTGMILFLMISVLRQDQDITSLRKELESIQTTLEHDHKEMKQMGKKIQELEDINHETAKILESQSQTINHLTETVQQQDDYIKELERNHDSDIDDVRGFAESIGVAASTYTRWGRSDCPANGTELVYDGYVGGSYYSHKGGASNYVCLTKQPLWGHVQVGRQSYAMEYGAEYEFNGHTGNGKDFFGKDLLDFDVPCAVCRTTRPTVIMIPGRNRCFDDWTLEYHGYLAADYKNYLPTEYTCIDKSTTTVTESKTNENGALFYLVEAICGSLKCPPYIDGAELTCVFCSK